MEKEQSLPGASPRHSGAAAATAAVIESIQTLVKELRALRIDQAEWGCLETLVIAGKGTNIDNGILTSVLSI